MKSGSCQECGIVITILSCSQPHHKKEDHQDPSVDDKHGVSIALGMTAARRSLGRGISLQRIIILFQPAKCCLSFD